MSGARGRSYALHPGARLALVAGAGAAVLLGPLPVALAVGALALALVPSPRRAAWLLVAGAVLAATNALVLRVALGAWTPGLVAGAKGAALLAAAGAFAARTPPWEAVAALGRFPRAAVVVGAVLRMAPAVAEDARRLHDAARLRGESRLARLRLAAPLFLCAVRRGERFGDALALAGFPSRARRYRRPPWRALDSAACAVAVLLATGVALWT